MDPNCILDQSLKPGYPSGYSFLFVPIATVGCPMIPLGIRTHWCISLTSPKLR